MRSIKNSAKKRDMHANFIRIVRASAIALVLGYMLHSHGVLTTDVPGHGNGSYKSADGVIMLAVCTVVRNDVPYLPEWIEFYRIQGFTKFWIFDDSSSDDVAFLQDLYEQQSPGQSLVEVHKHTTPGEQESAYPLCHKWALEHRFDWVAVIDTDEVWYSPTYPSVLEYIRAEIAHDTTIGNIRVTQYRFGTSGQKSRFTYKIRQNNGTTSLHNPNGVQLITASHIHRGPYTVFGEPAELIDANTPNCSIPAADGWKMCHTTIVDGKSMWNPKAVGPNISVHWPRQLRSGYRSITADPTSLRGNHYYYRSYEDAIKKSIDWQKPGPIEGVERVDSYWNSVQDIGILRLARHLHERVGSLLSPDSFVHRKTIH